MCSNILENSPSLEKQIIPVLKYIQQEFIFYLPSQSFYFKPPRLNAFQHIYVSILCK